MKRLYTVALLTAMALSAVVVVASAQVAPETGARYAGHITLNLADGSTTSGPAPLAAAATGDVYSNVTSAVNFAFSSTSLVSIWGDQLAMTGGGLLDQNDFTIYNSSSSTGPLNTAQVTVSFFDGTTFAALGNYTTNSVSLALPAGYYTIITVTGLSSAGINLPANIIMTQAVASYTGTPSRLGIVSMDPPTIGTSPATMYINSSTVGSAGFYNISTYNANPGYRVNVTNATPANSSTWGRVKSLYR